jgi:hypothetical protein
MSKKDIKAGIERDAPRLSEKEIQEALAEIDSLEKQLMEQQDLVQSADPFWHYQPSTGIISQEAKDFLLQFLKPEDIPPRLDGQMDVHQCLSPIIGASGGNQSGKTTVGAIEAFIKTTGQLPFSLEGKYPVQKLPKKYPQFVRVVGEDYVNGILLNLIPTYRKWVPRDFLFGGSWEKAFSSEQSLLRLGHKGQLTGTIEFMSNKQDVGSFQGPPRHKMIYDEEPRRDIRQENMLRFTTADSFDELYCMTPTKGMTWIHAELFEEYVKGSLDYVNWFKLPSVTNKKANLKVLMEIMKGITDYETRKMRLLGEFISLSGLIYGRLFDRKIHVVESFEITPDWLVYRGLDPHTAKPSAGVEVAVNREGQFVVCGAFKEAVDTEELKAIMATRARERKYRLAWTRCDKSANSTNKLLNDQNVYKLLQRGLNAIPALFLSDKFTGSIKAGVEVIKDLLKVNPQSGKPGLVIMNKPELQDLIASFQSLERESYVNEDVKGQKDSIAEGKHDKHAALRYVFQGLPRWMPPQFDVDLPEPVSDLTGY